MLKGASDDGGVVCGSGAERLMPFQSQAQRAYLFMHHPEVAHKWAAEYPNQGKLPMHKNPKQAVAEALASQKKKGEY